MDSVGGSLKERLRSDLILARRARDRGRTLLLTTTLSELRNREIELGRDAGDDDVVDVLSRAVKRRREAAEQMRAGHRPELAEKEEREAEWLAAYMPAALTEPDVRELIRSAIAGGAADMGAVMGRVMPKIKGRFDGREASRIAREELG
jgi:uncharacterized protein